MHRVLLLGAGKIGRMIAKFLSATGDYDLLVGDRDAEALERLCRQSEVETRVIDAANPLELADATRSFDSVISALSYQFNPAVAQAAIDAGASYFDLTEDLATSRLIREMASQARPGQILM